MSWLVGNLFDGGGRSGSGHNPPPPRSQGQPLRRRASSVRRPGKSYNRLPIHLATGGQREIEYGDAATTSDLATRLAEELGAAASWMRFGIAVLRSVDDGFQLRRLHPEDPMSRASDLVRESSTKGGLCKAWLWILTPAAGARLSELDDATLHYWFAQCSMQFLAGGHGQLVTDCGGYTTSDDDAIIQLGSLHIGYYLVSSRADLPDTVAIKEKTVASLEREIGYQRFLPEDLLQRTKVKALRKTVFAHLKAAQCTSQVCAEKYITILCDRIPTFGRAVVPLQLPEASACLVLDAHCARVDSGSEPRQGRQLFRFENVQSMRVGTQATQLKVVTSDNQTHTLQCADVSAMDTLCAIVECCCRVRDKRKTFLTRSHTASTMATVPEADNVASGSVQRVDEDHFTGVLSDETFGEIRVDRADIPRHELVLGKAIGQGEFGSVLQAVWNRRDNRPLTVAVKQLHEGASEADFVGFFKEADHVAALDHPNIVRFLGMSEAGAPLIVLEYMAEGNLQSFLLKNASSLRKTSLSLQFCRQIASAMVYMSEQDIVHRDLAARNVLVNHDRTVKLSDFGMARKLENGVYHAQETKLPIKWLAPETINFRQHTIKSDVWMYAVCAWETLSYGVKPFANVPNEEVLDRIESGHRLPQPSGCPTAMYTLLLACWSLESRQRPGFGDIETQARGFLPGSVSAPESPFDASVSANPFASTLLMPPVPAARSRTAPSSPVFGALEMQTPQPQPRSRSRPRSNFAGKTFSVASLAPADPWAASPLPATPLAPKAVPRRSLTAPPSPVPEDSRVPQLPDTSSKKTERLQRVRQQQSQSQSQQAQSKPTPAPREPPPRRHSMESGLTRRLRSSGPSPLGTRSGSQPDPPVSPLSPAEAALPDSDPLRPSSAMQFLERLALQSEEGGDVFEPEAVPTSPGLPFTGLDSLPAANPFKALLEAGNSDSGDVDDDGNGYGSNSGDEGHSVGVDDGGDRRRREDAGGNAGGGIRGEHGFESNAARTAPAEACHEQEQQRQQQQQEQQQQQQQARSDDQAPELEQARASAELSKPKPSAVRQAARPPRRGRAPAERKHSAARAQPCSPRGGRRPRPSRSPKTSPRLARRIETKAKCAVVGHNEGHLADVPQALSAEELLRIAGFGSVGAMAPPGLTAFDTAVSSMMQEVLHFKALPNGASRRGFRRATDSVCMAFVGILKACRSSWRGGAADIGLRGGLLKLQPAYDNFVQAVAAGWDDDPLRDAVRTQCYGAVSHLGILCVTLGDALDSGRSYSHARPTAGTADRQ